EHVVIGRRQTVRHEDALEPPSKLLRRRLALGMDNEDELTARDGLRHARKDVVITRQILVQRLATPEHGRVRSQTKAGSSGGCRRGIKRVLVKRQGEEPERTVPNMI